MHVSYEKDPVKIHYYIWRKFRHLFPTLLTKCRKFSQIFSIPPETVAILTSIEKCRNTDTLKRVAIATFRGRRRICDTMAQSVAIGTTLNVATATQCLGVAIATFGGTRRNSDAYSTVGITTVIFTLHKSTKLICTLHKNSKLICVLHKNNFIVSYLSQ